MTDVKMSDFGHSSQMFVYGIGRIENMGAVSRILFYVPAKFDDRHVNDQVLELIVPTDQLGKMAATLVQPTKPSITELDGTDWVTLQ